MELATERTHVAYLDYGFAFLGHDFRRAPLDERTANSQSGFTLDVR